MLDSWSEMIFAHNLVSCMHHADATIFLLMFRYNNIIYYQTSFRKEENLLVCQRGKWAIWSGKKSFRQIKQAIDNLEQYQNHYFTSSVDPNRFFTARSNRWDDAFSP